MNNNTLEQEVYNHQLRIIHEEKETLKDKPGIDDYISYRIKVLNQLFGINE
jgi:hypothetical protein